MMTGVHFKCTPVILCAFAGKGCDENAEIIQFL